MTSIKTLLLSSPKMKLYKINLKVPVNSKLNH